MKPKWYNIEDYHLSVDGDDYSPALRRAIEAIDKYRNRWWCRLWRNRFRFVFQWPIGEYRISQSHDFPPNTHFVSEESENNDNPA